MRRISAVALVVSLALFMVSPAAIGSEVIGDSIGVRYIWDGPSGELTIANAPGYPFVARGSDGRAVAKGVVQGTFFSIMVPNVGPDIHGVVLRTTVGDILFETIDWDWRWD